MTLTPSIPNSEVSNWVIAPATQCVTLLGEGMMAASVIDKAVIALAHQRQFLNVTRNLLRTHRKDTSAIDRLLAAQVGGLEGRAREIIRDDFAPIRRHGIIWMWVAIEVAIEDTAVLVLTKDPSSVSLISKAGLKLPKSVSPPLTEEDARKVYKRLEQETRKGCSVADGYIRLLSVLDISITVSEKVSASLSELNYVRNCILHRAGIADNRVSIEAPRLSVELGKPIHISLDQHLHYYDMVSKFAVALVKSVIASKYCKTATMPT